MKNAIILEFCCHNTDTDTAHQNLAVSDFCPGIFARHASQESRKTRGSEEVRKSSQCPRDAI